MKTIIKLVIKALLVFLFILQVFPIWAQSSTHDEGSLKLVELKTAIKQKLDSLNITGAIILIDSNETILMETYGKADIERNIDATNNTMFRLGSVSKMYAALAILKLQEQGKLSLKEEISELIPEIEYKNPWEETHPILVEHLLEHTSGFAYWYYAELGDNDPSPKTLKEALDFYPASRVSKFVPGSRSSYSNVGIATAAYIVEKVSGMAYEKYIDKYFFKPMGIENMTFLETPAYQNLAAKRYDDGIGVAYYHILYRPAGSLNSSIKDMQPMLELFINRGQVNGVQILSDSSLKRMERMESLFIPEYRVFDNGGLCSQRSSFKGQIYHGHGGHVPGGVANLGYLPKHNKAYAVLTNGTNDQLVYEISQLIKSYQTRNLPELSITDKAFENYKSTQDLTGFYTIVQPKFELTRFLEDIKLIHKVWHQNDTLCVKTKLGQFSGKYIANSEHQYRSVKSNKIKLVQLNDPADGEVLIINGIPLRKISAFWAYTMLTIFFAFVFVPLTITVFAIIALLIFMIGKKKNKKALWSSLWPFFTSSILLIMYFAISMNMETRLDSFILIGTMNPVSVFIFFASIAFAISSLWSFYYIIKNWNSKGTKLIYYHSLIAAFFNCVFTLYFLYHGMIGIQTWV